jgi:hypothetical protein
MCRASGWCRRAPAEVIREISKKFRITRRVERRSASLPRDVFAPLFQKSGKKNAGKELWLD